MCLSCLCLTRCRGLAVPNLCLTLCRDLVVHAFFFFEIVLPGSSCAKFKVVFGRVWLCSIFGFNVVGA